MIFPIYKPLYTFFWKKYFSFILNKNFTSINIEGSLPNRKSVLLISNHISWWDGILFFYVSECVFQKRFGVIMLKETLEAHKVLRTAGGIGIEKKSKKIVEAIQFANNYLKEKDNVLTVFPQGKIFSQLSELESLDFGFIKNVSKSADTVLFSALFIDYFDKKKPSVYIYLEEYNHLESDNLEDLYKAYFLKTKKNHALKWV